MALGDHKKHKPNWSLENATFSCSSNSRFPVTLSIPLLGINQTKQKGDDGADVLRGRYFDLVQVGELSAANTPEPTVKLQAAEDT